MELHQHPDQDTLLSVAAGDSQAARTAARHLAGCGRCLARVAELRGVLDTASDELLELRPDCPPPHELALIPPGGESDHPHVRHCPLCREEVRLLFELETQERLDIAIGDGPFIRPELVEYAAAMAYQAAEDSSELALRQGAETAVAIGGATVRMRVAGGELVVELEGRPEGELYLLLSDDLLEKRVPLARATLRVAVGRWKRANVAAR
ncbi:MAG: hypothetical protein GY856_30500 [bacterium]|nr:hypothetical protein [bacterium]